MKVFCPNCGSDNEGTPGGRLTCRACTASFEVPRESTGQTQPPPTSQPPPASQPWPGMGGAPPPTHQPWPGLGGSPTGAPRPGGDWGGRSPSEPISTFSTPSTVPVVTNPLAIVSLVLGILCCFPFAVGAIITGIIARNQIASSGGQQKGAELAMVGIVLGCLSLAANMLMTITSIIGR